MNPREAGEVLVMMQAAWPGFAKDDAAAELWMRYLERQDPIVARHAAGLLIESIGPRFSPGPTVAEWQDACRDGAARFRPPQRAITEAPPASPEFVHRVVEDAKRLAAEKAGPLSGPLIGALNGAGSRTVHCEHPAFNKHDGACVCASCGTPESEIPRVSCGTTKDKP